VIEPKVRFRILTDDQIARIHAATMRLMEETGCEVEHERGLEVLRKAGAKVDGTRVRIGRELVEEALRRAPREVILGDRDGKPAMDLGGDRVYFGTGSDCLYVLDGDTGVRRKAVLEDVRRFARLSEALPGIDFIMSMACPSDVPPERLYLEQFAAMVAESAKPVVFTVINPADVRAIHRMSVAAVGSESAHRVAPHLLLYPEPVSPLKHPQASVEKVLLCGELGIPITYAPGGLGGGNMPVTGAGAVVQTVAEIFAGLVIQQFAYPGAGFVFGGCIGVMDLSTMINVYGPPFSPTWTAAVVEMGKHYGLPTWSLAGCSDSKVVDEQAGIDSALMTLCAALNGANLVHDVGYIESGLTSSLEMLAISDEVIAVVARMVEGLRTDDDALALDAIGRVGPGGNFFGDDHTLANFRREMFVPRLLDYRMFDRWKSAGSKSMLDRARERVKELLAAPPPART